MSLFLAEKVISSVPEILSPDTVYFVRVGVGFDLYVSDSTGSVAHKLNSNGSSAVVVVDDFFETDNLTPISGNVLLNDGGASTVLFINGSGGLVGDSVSGSDGGSFIILSNGEFTFNPNTMDPGETRISYTATNGSTNGTAILSISVTENTLITESRLYFEDDSIYSMENQLFVKN